MKERLTVGKVLRPRGLKGVVKVEAYSDDTSRWRSFRTLGIGGKTYKVEDMTSESGVVYVKLGGVERISANSGMCFNTARRMSMSSGPTTAP